MNHARALGVRIVVDLVVNHTSIDHPWFQSARRGPESPHFDWYIWADERPENHDQGMVFPGVQKTTWTYDRQARKYYFHSGAHELALEAYGHHWFRVGSADNALARAELEKPA